MPPLHSSTRRTWWAGARKGSPVCGWWALCRVLSEAWAAQVLNQPCNTACHGGCRVSSCLLPGGDKAAQPAICHECLDKDESAVAMWLQVSQSCAWLPGRAEGRIAWSASSLADSCSVCNCVDCKGMYGMYVVNFGGRRCQA